MTRKDFELIAAILSDLGDSTYTRQELAERFAAALRKTNPRFDAARFIAAATFNTYEVES